MLAGSAMHFCSRGTKLQHFPRNHDTTSGFHRGQGVDHGVERLWIGIVAIVDDCDVTQLENLAAFIRRGESCQRVHRFRRLQPTSDADGHGGKGIQNVVFSDQRYTRVLATSGYDQVKLRTFRATSLRVLSSYICRDARSVGDDLAFEIAAE